jgi:predicted lipid carrier protein YhbT
MIRAMAKLEVNEVMAMTTVRDKMQLLNARLLERSAEARALDAVYRFVFDGEGGGTFVVNLKDDVGVKEADEPAPCTIRMSSPDAVELFEGRGDGQAWFFAQRLKVEGDLSQAFKLQAVMDMMK